MQRQSNNLAQVAQLIVECEQRLMDIMQLLIDEPMSNETIAVVTTGYSGDKRHLNINQVVYALSRWKLFAEIEGDNYEQMKDKIDVERRLMFISKFLAKQ